MKVYINQKADNVDVSVEIHCCEVTDKVNKLKRYLERFEDRVSGKEDGETKYIDVNDILYLEAVDGKIFLYTSDCVLETDKKLYEFEAQLDTRDFFRCNKSTIVNVNQIKSLRPELTRNIRATMSSGEVIEISRRYVKAFKKLIGNESDTK